MKFGIFNLVDVFFTKICKGKWKYSLPFKYPEKYINKVQFLVYVSRIKYFIR